MHNCAVFDAKLEQQARRAIRGEGISLPSLEPPHPQVPKFKTGAPHRPARMPDGVLVVVSAGIAVLAGLGLIVVLILLRGKKGEDEVAFEILGEETTPSTASLPGSSARSASDFAVAPPNAPAAAPPRRPAAPLGRDVESDSFSVSRDELDPRALPPRFPARPTLPPLPPGPPNVPTEWARRQVGPLEPGRVRGICSGCGTTISVSRRRPLRVACPVCGRTRLLS